MLSILNCSPLWLQSLDPCSISAYSFLGAFLITPITAIITYINENFQSIAQKLPKYVGKNDLPKDENGFKAYFPNENGELVFENIIEGKYILTETETNEEYMLQFRKCIYRT